MSYKLLLMQFLYPLLICALNEPSPFERTCGGIHVGCWNKVDDGFVRRNWKQCTFNALNNDADTGKIMECEFEKKSSYSSLRILYNGDIRSLPKAAGTGCSRWYITVNDKECASPGAIDANILSSSKDNIHRIATIDGFCDGIPRGIVKVGLYIGACHTWPGVSLGNGYTCWNSHCRFIIEEVEKSQ